MNLKRLAYVGVILAVLVGALIGRLAQLQLFEHQIWLEAAESSRTEKRAIAFLRGRILDARGQVLANDSPAFDLHVVYRDFRRGDPARGIPGHLSAQLLETFQLLPIEIRHLSFGQLGIRRGSLEECFAHAAELGAALLALEPGDFGGLRTSTLSDLRFYLRTLFGLESAALEAWISRGAGPLSAAFPGASERYSERVERSRRELLTLEGRLELRAGELLERVERQRLRLEQQLRLRAARQAAGFSHSLSVAKVLDCLDGQVDTREGPLTGVELLADLMERWRLAEAGLVAEALRNLLVSGTKELEEEESEEKEPVLPAEGLERELAELGELLRQVELASPKDLAGARRALSKDLHARDRLLKSGLSFEAVDLVIRNTRAYPGLRVLEKPRRMYPDDTVLTLIGRAGEQRDARQIEKQREEYKEYRELAHNLHRSRDEEARYRDLRERVRREHSRAGETHGVSGVELAFDEALRGKRGYLDQLQAGPSGERQQELDFVAPVDGKDVRLSLDTSLVQAAERAIREGYRRSQQRVMQDADLDDRLIPGLGRPRAGLVLMDLRDGSVPVLASLPTYGAGDLRRRFDELEADPDRPLYHRALGFNFGPGSKTPYPGSTFKLVVAYAALREDLSAWESEHECHIVYKSMRCDTKMGHGVLDMHEAIKRSCNVYFYKLGEELGYERLYQAAAELGFGEPTGMLDGLLELRPSILLRHPRDVRGRSDAASRQIAIGQSHVVVSPLQMARFYGWLATGRLLTPRLVAEVGEEEQPVHWDPVPYPPGVRERLQGALRDVVFDVHGTAHGDGLEPFGVAGKTGTAQVSESDAGPSDVHSWFAGYFPCEAPRWSVAVYCENTGLHGGDCATHVLAEFLNSPEMARLLAEN